MKESKGSGVILSLCGCSVCWYFSCVGSWWSPRLFEWGRPLLFTFCFSTQEFLLNLLNPGTIILCLVHIILLLTSYLCLNNCKSTSSPHASGHPAASDHVRVPRNRFQPCNTLLTLLSTFDPLGSSYDFGCDIYLQVVNTVGHHLSHGCDHCMMDWLCMKICHKLKTVKQKKIILKHRDIKSK